MNLTIRSAAPQDAPLLSDLGARTFRESYADYNDPADMDFHVADNLGAGHFRDALADPNHQIFLLLVEEEAAGFVQLVASAKEQDGRSLEIRRIYLLQKFQGKGLGAHLMRHCLTTARQGGYHALWLGVWKKNTKAIAFYEKMGFRITGEHIFQLGSDPQEDWLMTLDLTD